MGELRRAALRLTLSLLAAAAAPAAAAGPSAAPTPFQQHAALFMMKCAKCHTVGGGRRVGPDLRGVAQRHDKEWLVGFVMNPESYLESDPAAKKLMAENAGVRMENTHLTRPQAEGLLEYIKAASAAPASSSWEKGAPVEEPLSEKLRMPEEGRTVSVPGVVALLLLLAAAAALAQWGETAGSRAAVVAALAVAYWSFGGRRYHHLLGNQQGYQPEQPVAFSHALHAGHLTVSCFYCHSGAERSDVAGVPAVNVCMNCHAAVRARAGRKDPSPEIAKLAAVWDARRDPAASTIPWVRVQHLPDFVHFSHRVHVADDIQCQECHGPVQGMERTRQAAPLSMGWCIRCHRESPGAAPSHWKRVGGPLDCAACHW